MLTMTRALQYMFGKIGFSYIEDIHKNMMNFHSYAV